MAHIKLGLAEAGKYELLVDGVDLSLSVMAEGFGIDFTGPVPVVMMQLAADALEMDLPEAVVEAICAGEGAA